MLTKIQWKTWMHFPTSNTLKMLQTQRLNHCHLLCRGRKYTLARALSWSITLLSYGNTTLTVASRPINNTIPTTHLRSVNSTNISNVGSRGKAWRSTMRTGWRKNIPLCISHASNIGMGSKSSGLPCQMIRISGSGNYTLSRIWDGMTIAHPLSNTGVERSSLPWDGWWGSQPMPRISFMSRSVALTAIRYQNAFIPKCTQYTGGGRQRQGEILQDNNVLIGV